MKILILRFSAMGDVLLLYPVLRNLLENNPKLQITFATREKFTVFFQDIPRLKAIAVDFEKQYKGAKGVFRLFQSLKKERFDAVVDLHQNLRTWLLRVFFTMYGVKFIGFDKGRNEKKKWTRKKNKQRITLPHTTERYLKAFRSLALKTSSQSSYFFESKTVATDSLQNFLNSYPFLAEKKCWIGIAPFAQHETKIWGLPKIEKLMYLLEKEPDVSVFLFGGGNQEVNLLNDLQDKFPQNTVCVAGKLSLKEEIQLLPHLKAMLCMDSSNMHLATLAGIPTISIWGATHPAVGFAPLYQPENQLIQIPIEDLECRPCSVYGNQPCLRGDKACMEWIAPEQVYAQLKMFFE